MQTGQVAAGNVNPGFTRRPASFSEGGLVEIPEFLRKKGSSRYPRV